MTTTDRLLFQDEFRSIHDLIEVASLAKQGKPHMLFEARQRIRELERAVCGPEPEDDERELAVIDPAFGEPFERIAPTSRKALGAAIAAAGMAQKDWRTTNYVARRVLIWTFTKAIRDHGDELAQLLVREQGKPLAEARAEIQSSCELADTLASIELHDEKFYDSTMRWSARVHHEPRGVVGVIAPWNAPVRLALGPAVAALYTGNTVIVKPSPFTPLTTAAIGEIAKRVLPKDLFQVVIGGDDLGRALVAHPWIGKISFTGSTTVGRDVGAACAARLVPCTLELGGNDAAIVLPDVDVDDAAPKIFDVVFANAGQVCMAIKRLYIHKRVFEPMCEALVELARKVVLGHGLDPGTTMGPIQNKPQYERVRELRALACHSGRVLIDGRFEGRRPGYFVPPTIVADLPDDHRLVVEEQFGPVLPVLAWSDPHDVLTRANATLFGLGGSVWGSDLDEAEAMASRLEVGTAWVNQHRVVTGTVPFGGTKHSGLGRRYGKQGLLANMDCRTLRRRLP